MAMVFCRGCGKEIHDTAPACPHCGAPQAAAVQSGSSRRILPVALLCWLVGIFGVHRFYVGKVGTGLLQLFTLGGLTIWTLIDLIMIIMGKFTDKAGNRITLWT